MFWEGIIERRRRRGRMVLVWVFCLMSSQLDRKGLIPVSSHLL